MASTALKAPATLDEFLAWGEQQPERYDRAGNASMYPELFVRGGPREGKRTRIEDAMVAVEVLSPRTAKDDLTRKRRAYTALPTMRVVVYASQDEPRLDVVRRRADGGFNDEVVEGLSGVLELPEIGVRLAMIEIYEDTEVARTAAG